VPPTKPKPSDTYYGWWVAQSLGGIAMYWTGTFSTGMTALFTPIQSAFGLSAAAVTFAFSMKQPL